MIATATPTKPATQRKTEYESGFTPWGTPCSVKRDKHGQIVSAYSGTGNLRKRDLPAIRIKAS